MVKSVYPGDLAAATWNVMLLLVAGSYGQVKLKHMYVINIVSMKMYYLLEYYYILNKGGLLYIQTKERPNFIILRKSLCTSAL